MNHKSILLPLLSSLAAALLLASASCDRRPATPTRAGAKPATVPVTLGPAKIIPVQRSVDVVGTLYGDEEAVISAKVGGPIIKLYKDVGDSVEPGEPLVQLKPNDYQLAVDKAKLAMEQALAKLGLKELPPKDYDVTKVPTVIKAQFQEHNAKGKLDRGRNLFEAKPTPLMSEQEFADLQTAHEVAKSSYNVELLSARALVAEAWALKGELEIARQRLADATTRAPSPPAATDLAENASTNAPAKKHTYRITARLVNEGELVKEYTPCYRLIDDDPIKLRARVLERHVGEVKIGAKVIARVEAYDQDFIGAVSRINPQIDQDNRTFLIEVLIPNADHRLMAGAFAKAAVLTHVDPRVVFAPKDALISFAGVHKVFTIKDNTAVEISVDPAEAADTDPFIEIRKGLTGTEDLVITGASRLATGVPVKITPPAATQSAQK